MQIVDGDEYILVSEETNIDETGLKTIHRSYIKNIAMPYDLIRNELSIYETYQFDLEGIPWAEIWIKGTFAYYPDAKTCFVHNPSSGSKKLNETAKVTKTEEDHDFNQGGGLFGTGKKYAYIERTLTLDNGGWKGEHTFSFRIQVNSDGDITRKHTYK